MKSTHISNSELGQLRPPGMDEIQRRIDRSQWDTSRQQNYQKLMAALTNNANQFIQASQNKEQQSARVQPVSARDQVRPAATPQPQPATRQDYQQAQGRSLADEQSRQRSLSHLPANVQQAMRRNQQRDDRQQARKQALQQLTEHGKSAMRAVGNAFVKRPAPPQQEHPQRSSLHDLQAKVATQKRVEKNAEKAPNLFDKYVGQRTPQQRVQQQAKEQGHDRQRTR